MLPDVLAQRARLIVGFAEPAVLVAALISLVALVGLDQFSLAHLRLLGWSVLRSIARPNAENALKFLRKWINWISAARPVGASAGSVRARAK